MFPKGLQISIYVQIIILILCDKSHSKLVLNSMDEFYNFMEPHDQISEKALQNLQVKLYFIQTWHSLIIT